MSKYTYYKVKFKGKKRPCLYYRSKLKRIDLETTCIPVGKYEYWTDLTEYEKGWCKSYDMCEVSYRKRLIPITEGEFMLELI
jgi:hypothetical protein